MASLLSEFIGTFMLVFTVGCNALGKTSEEWAVTSIACTLMVMIYAFASISGAHLNPAVTLSQLFARKTGLMKCVAYIVVQLLAALTASTACERIFQAQTSLGPAAGYDWWQACLVELLYTTMLALVVLCVTSKMNNPEHEPNQFFGLAIAFVVIAGGYGGGKISGGAFNPAVALGLGVHEVKQSVLYMLYEACGAVLAAILFRALRPDEYMPARPEDYEPRLLTRLVSEFTGTFFLVLTVGLNVLCQSSLTAWSAAAALLSMVYALGDISGGHLNPAVTLAVACARKGVTTARDILFYWLAQAAGGVAAGMVYTLIGKGSFSLGPKVAYTDRAAYIMEFTFTLVLCLAVLSVACVKGIATPLGRNNYYGLAIGFALAGGGFAASNVSGGCLNPALALGIGLSNIPSSGLTNSMYMATFSAAELLGGIGAAMLFISTHAKEYSVAKGDRRLFSQLA